MARKDDVPALCFLGYVVSYGGERNRKRHCVSSCVRELMGVD